MRRCLRTNPLTSVTLEEAVALVDAKAVKGGANRATARARTQDPRPQAKGRRPQTRGQGRRQDERQRSKGKEGLIFPGLTGERIGGSEFEQTAQSLPGASFQGEVMAFISSQPARLARVKLRAPSAEERGARPNSRTCCATSQTKVRSNRSAADRLAGASSSVVVADITARLRWRIDRHADRMGRGGAWRSAEDPRGRSTARPTPRRFGGRRPRSVAC